MALNKVFIRNLKKWRKVAGISQEKLAELCQSAHSYIRQIECGNRHPSFAFIEKISNALNVEPYKLFIDDSITESDSAVKSNIVKSIKKGFLERVGCEFDNAIREIEANGPSKKMEI